MIRTHNWVFIQVRKLSLIHICPGGTNALTGVLGGWLDSIPMLVVSGQVRYDTTARYMQQFTNGLPIRAVGDQEFDITKAAASMCKYAVMLLSLIHIL